MKYHSLNRKGHPSIHHVLAITVYNMGNMKLFQDVDKHYADKLVAPPPGALRWQAQDQGRKIAKKMMAQSQQAYEAKLKKAQGPTVPRRLLLPNCPNSTPCLLNRVDVAGAGRVAGGQRLHAPGLCCSSDGIGR